MEIDDRTWLKHVETGHLWEAPTGVVEDMAKAGWHPTDERPVPFDPTLAERPKEWWDPVPAPEPEKPKSKRASAVSTEESDSVG